MRSGPCTAVHAQRPMHSGPCTARAQSVQAPPFCQPGPASPASSVSWRRWTAAPGCRLGAPCMAAAGT
eukprot:363585-Chlamydomonas_euryale.AAC.4